MVISRTCKGHKQDGAACGAAPLQEGEYCYMHDPAHAGEAAKARSLGGQRRRRESTLGAAFDVGPLDTVGGIRRVLEVVTFDGLGMEVSIARGRLLIAATQGLTKLLETGELTDRVEALEAAVSPPPKQGRRR